MNERNSMTLPLLPVCWRAGTLWYCPEALGNPVLSASSSCRKQLHFQSEKHTIHHCNNNNNNNSYITLYPVKNYEFAALYIINAKINLTIKKKKRKEKKHKYYKCIHHYQHDKIITQGLQWHWAMHFILCRRLPSKLQWVQVTISIVKVELINGNSTLSFT